MVAAARAGGADGGDDLGAQSRGMVRPWRHATGRAGDQDGAEIVDVGEGRSAIISLAQSVEQAVAVVVGKARARVDAECARLGQGVRTHDRAGGGAGAVDAVGVARQRPDHGSPFSATARPSRTDAVRRAFPAAHRHRGLAAREQHAGRRQRWPVATTDRAMPAMTLPLRGFPSSASPRISGVTPPPRPRRRRLPATAAAWRS